MNYALILNFHRLVRRAVLDREMCPASYVTEAEAEPGSSSCPPETIDAQRVGIDGSFQKFQEEALICGDCGKTNDLHFGIWCTNEGQGWARAQLRFQLCDLGGSLPRAKRGEGGITLVLNSVPEPTDGIPFWYQCPFSLRIQVLFLTIFSITWYSPASVREPVTELCSKQMAIGVVPHISICQHSGVKTDLKRESNWHACYRSSVFGGKVETGTDDQRLKVGQTVVPFNRESGRPLSDASILNMIRGCPTNASLPQIAFPHNINTAGLSLIFNDEAL